MSFTLVYYYIPQDQDELQTPNAYGIGKPQNEIRLQDIQSNFPLEGQYHFRFKYKHDGKPIWLDINERQVIPTFNECIYVKATRISWEKENLPQIEKINLQEQAKVNGNQQKRQQQSNTNGNKTQSTQQAQNNNNNHDLLDF